MTKCAVLLCKNYSNRTTDVSFHPFPTDQTRKREWIKAVRRQKSWVSTKHHRICSLHFEPHCFNENATKQRKLNKNAVPTLHLPELFQFQSIADSALYSIEVKTERVEEPLNPGNSLTGENEECLRTGRLATSAIDPLSPKYSNSTSDADSNASIDCKSKGNKNIGIGKNIKEKEETCKEHINKIESLLKANRRLCQQNKNLKRILMTMKKKIKILEGESGKISDEEDST